MPIISLSNLVASSVIVSKVAASIIRAVKASGDLGIEDKSTNDQVYERQRADYVTKADKYAQLCIIGYLKNKYKNLCIVGEEEESEIKSLQNEELQEILTTLGSHKRITNCNYDEFFDEIEIVLKKYEHISHEVEDLIKDIKNIDLEMDKMKRKAKGYDLENYEVDMKYITVWVDPLDGTSEYVKDKGRIVEITTLIGIAYRGRPIAGVINQPFSDKSVENVNLERIVWGINGLGAFNKYFFEENPHKKISETIINKIKVITGKQFEKIKQDRVSKLCSVITTRNNTNEEMNSFIQKLRDDLNETFHSNDPNLVKNFSGAGYKTLLLIDGSDSCYLFPSVGTKRWDTCAPEAVLRSINGNLTDCFGKDYPYTKPDSDKYTKLDPQFENTNGLIASTRDHLFFVSKLETYIQVLLEKSKNRKKKKPENAESKPDTHKRPESAAKGERITSASKNGKNTEERISSALRKKPPSDN